MRIAYVGCGYVADLYQHTLANHRDKLELVGVFDRDPERMAAFAGRYGVPAHTSLSHLVADDRVDIVLNLTNPESHYEVTKTSLAAGKHVYSEKPLAMDVGRARKLVEEARRARVHLASAPCSLLGETAQTIWKALRASAIGQVYLAYAELDGGLMHRQPYRSWVSQTGAYWPAANEFETGCTVEHAGYLIAWLVAFFGPVRRVTSFSSCLVKDKKTDEPLSRNAPDFSSGCIEFDSGVVARITNSIVARRNRRLSIFGEEGILTTLDSRDYGSPVYLERHDPGAPSLAGRIRRRLAKAVAARGRSPETLGSEVPLVRAVKLEGSASGQRKDLMRGVAEMAEAIRDRRPCRLSAELGLHVTEVALALQHPERMGLPREIESSCAPIEPMPWAR
jgi:predicted dehydrogenase